MKLVAFMGSPRKNGNIDTIIKEIVKGATEKNIECKIYYLSDLNIQGCKGCFYCRKNPTCAIKDDMVQVYEDIKQADYLILGTPIYIYQISAQLKTLLDRFYPLTEGERRHTPRFGIKKTIMVYSHASPISIFFRMYIRYTNKSLDDLGIKVFKTIIMKGAFERNSAKNNKKILDKSYKIGKSLD